MGNIPRNTHNRHSLSTDSNATILWCGQFFFLGTYYDPHSDTHHLPCGFRLMVYRCEVRWSPVVLIESYRHPIARPQFSLCHPNNPLPFKATFLRRWSFIVWVYAVSFPWGMRVYFLLLNILLNIPQPTFTPPYKIHKLDTTNFLLNKPFAVKAIISGWFFFAFPGG